MVGAGVKAFAMNGARRHEARELIEDRPGIARDEILDHDKRFADRLLTLFPGLVTVEYKSAAFALPQHFRACAVDLGDRRYTFEVTGDQIAYQVSHRVHGIDLSHVRLLHAEWLEQLFRAIADHTERLRTESDFGRLL